MGVSLAVIGGTGVYDPRMLSEVREEKVATPFGGVTVCIGNFHGREVAFVPRHGEKHSVPPHLINYRANIWSLRELGVERVLATAAVGSLNPDMRPGDFVLVNQFIDFTRSRKQTFYEGGEEGVFHVDMTDPYCPELRDFLFQCGNKLGFAVHREGVYVCTEGPRFETPAEIRMFRQWGGDVVGMTSVPEVVLARELGICYAAVAVVTNYAAGISPSMLTHSEVLEMMRINSERLRQILSAALEAVPAKRSCACAEVLKEAPLKAK